MTDSLSASTLIVASLFIASMVGCSDRSTTTAERETNQATHSAGQKIDQAEADIKAGAAKAGAAVTDATITAKVKGALIADPDLKARQIDVNTSGGAVTLSGTVDTPIEVEKAQSVARSVEGVKSVENHLQVKTTG